MDGEAVHLWTQSVIRCVADVISRQLSVGKWQKSCIMGNLTDKSLQICARTKLRAMYVVRAGKSIPMTCSLLTTPILERMCTNSINNHNVTV
jgi:hypothetical protein